MVNHLLVLHSVFSRVEWSLSLSKGVLRTFVTLAEKRGSILVFMVPWIPAFAGMTEMEKGITEGEAVMKEEKTGMT